MHGIKQSLTNIYAFQRCPFSIINSKRKLPLLMVSFNQNFKLVHWFSFVICMDRKLFSNIHLQVYEGTTQYTYLDTRRVLIVKDAFTSTPGYYRVLKCRPGRCHQFRFCSGRCVWSTRLSKYKFTHRSGCSTTTDRGMLTTRLRRLNHINILLITSTLKYTPG